MLKIKEINRHLAFVILIGGKSVRFGSDKGVFDFLGKPLVLHQIETILQFNKDIFLVANSQEQIELYKERIEQTVNLTFIIDGMELISDKELRTPMIGIYSAFKELDELGYEKAFILSCDSPLIKYEVVNLLVTLSENFDCCIPKWDNDFLEPLFAIYPVKRAFKKAEENIRKGTYKLTELLDSSWKINYVSIEQTIQPIDEKLLTFININGPIDVEKLMEMYRT